MTPSLRNATMMRAAAVRSVMRQNERMGARYARQASATTTAGHGDHSYPEENFSGPFWRNTFLAVVLSFAAWRISVQHTPAAKGASLDESHDPDSTPVEAKDESMPWLTRYIAYHLPRQGLWKERNDKHLELTIQQAEDKLLVQDAQRPVMRRTKKAANFDNASPHSIPVGSTIDLSDLQVRGNFNAPVGEDQ